MPINTNIENNQLKLYDFKVKEIPIDDRSHLFENTVNLLISW